MTISTKTKKVIKHLSDLVVFPVLGGESNLAIATHIEDIFKSYQIPYHRVENETADKTSLHCRIGPAVDGGIILSGHTDVVPTEGQPWTKPDFALTEENGKLFGRGSVDMKGFLACCLAMIPEMLNAPLQKPIYFAFSYDEEVGCQAGPALAQSINDTYSEKPAFAIIGEPSNMQTITAEKGIGIFTTSIRSSAAHSSQIRSSVSAVEEAAVLIRWLSAKMESLIAKGNIDPRFEPPHTTIHVGKIQGGTAVNIVADHCTFGWDVRNIPRDSIQEIVHSFEDFCAERIQENREISPQFDIKTVPEFPIVPGLDTDAQADIVQLANSLNGTQKVGSVAYASEAGQFAEAGFQAVICGPGSIDQAHQADEFIEIAELEKCLSFLEKLIDWSR